ncbi:hypothetical protein TSUD_55360 [Trifolium subterraneum]|uniref:Uncharacterized protein n=1 Tax=Trifolium subterraneum TaxID=3900 RepID=A0A2Z6MQC1_TRISU|nr:hypothetical protein TSUD_55360 [Trifolium subterraneum]
MASSSAPQSQAARNFKNDLIDFTLKSKMKEPVFRSRDVGKGRVPEFISHVTVDGLDFVTPQTFLQRKAADQEVCKIALEHFIKKPKEVLFCCQDNMSSLPERLLKIQKETRVTLNLPRPS